MSGLTKRRQRTRASYLVEMVLEGLIWGVNLVEIAHGFRTMELLQGVTAGMILLFAPVLIWQAYSSWREERV